MFRKADAMLYLELQILRNKEKYNLTPRDESIRVSYKHEAKKNFIAGVVAGGGAAIIATWKLGEHLRTFLISVGGSCGGMWLLSRSMYYCAEQILKLDGSILQKELVDILATKFQHYPESVALLSKHFYPETVFDDSTSNNPKIRWRHRNFFSNHDNENFFGNHDSDSYDKTQGDCHSDSCNNSQGESENVNDSRMVKAGADAMAELGPLDSLFGYDAPVEEIHHHHVNTPNKPTSGTHNRRCRRSRRRHQMRNHDDLLNYKHSAAAV